MGVQADLSLQMRTYDNFCPFLDAGSFSFCHRLASVRNSPTQKCRQGVPQTISSEATNQNYKWCGKEVISTGEKCCNNKKIPLEEECCGGKGKLTVG